MKRSDFIKSLSLLPLAASAMSLKDLFQETGSLPLTSKMPAVFVGHGSPTNALEDNEFVQGWIKVAENLPRPRAILMVSAHWETKGTQVTAMQQPKTIHDFGGFSPELYAMQYPAPGSPELAEEVKLAIQATEVAFDHHWGFDHGTWVPLVKMMPKADIPVLQLSLDYTKGAEYHYALAQELEKLRHKGVLIMGSGNMVHNLGMIRMESRAEINKEYGYDWALEMNTLFKQKIQDRDHASLANYRQLHRAANLAIPTPEHYLPLLYVLGVQGKDEQATFFNDRAIAGSLTMTSVLLPGE